MGNNWLRIITVIVAIGILGVCLLTFNAEAATTLTIKSVVIGPPNVAVSQNVTATVTFDSVGLTSNIGKTVSITYYYPGGPEGGTRVSAVIDGSKITMGNFRTPDSPCTVTYTVDAAGQASASGSFRVYGLPVSFIFTPLGTPFYTTDGTILVLANGFSKQKFLLTLKDGSNNTVFSDTFHVTQSDGVTTSNLPYTIDAQGQVLFTVGPTTTRTGDLIITAWLDWTSNVTYRLKFIDGQLSITPDKTRVDLADPSDKMINVTVTLKDGTDPLPRVNVSVKCIWPNGTVDTDHSKIYTTAGDGTITVLNQFQAGQFNSLNTMNVFIAQIQNLGLVDVSMVRGYSNNVSALTVYVMPADPASDGTSYRSVTADGVHSYALIAHVTDNFNNDAEGVPVTFDTYANLDARGNFTSEITNTYSYTTSDLGVASVMTQPMTNPGVIKVNISAGNLHKEVILYYMAGQPSRIYIRAFPDVLAASDVFNSNITYAINVSQVVAYVTDDWGHPIMGQPVNFSVQNVSNKTMGKVTPAKGITDINGEFQTQFALDYVNGSGEGTVQVVATSGLLNGTVPITYTENSHLNITTSVNRSRMAVNGTVGVTVKVDGVGWQEGRKPADVIFVMDRSGSMGDAIGYTNYGTSNGGWFAPNITSYTNLPKNTTTSITYNHDKQTRVLFKFWQQQPVVNYPTANAQYVSDDVPTIMMAGTSQTIHITMKNTGTVQWDEYNNTYSTYDCLRLLGRNGTVGSFAFANLDMTVLPSGTGVVYPGQSYTFTASITAPSVATNTTFYPYYRMYWYYGNYYNYGSTYTIAGPGYFGNTVQRNILVYPNPSATPTPTPTPTPYATLVSDTFPTAIKSGETKTVSVTMKNTGDVAFPWPITNSQYALGFGTSYLSFNIKPNTYYYVKNFAAADVIKNNQVTFTFNITGPSVFTNTTLGVSFQMLSNGSTWFGASTTRNIVVYNDTVPLASALWGDWYYYNLTYNGGSLSKGWAGIENPAVNTTGPVVVPTTDYIPTFGSNGSYPSPYNSNAALKGIYTINVTRYYNYGNDNPPFKIYIWDDMKMGQQYDSDAAAKRSAKTFIETNLTNIYDRAGLVTFGDSATNDSDLKLLNPVGANRTYLESNISKINSWGNTNLADGLLKARLEFESNPSPRSDSSKYIILLTDGYSTSDVNMDLVEAQNLANDHVMVFPIGIASAANQVNVSELSQIANITGGFYQLVDPKNILAAYTNIGRAMDQNITGVNSTLYLQGEQTNIAGVWMNNTTYVPGSAYVMTDNDSATLHPAPPTITMNGTNYVMSWPVNPVHVAGTWVLNYTVKANLDGPTHPIGNGSKGVFTQYGNISSYLPNQSVLSNLVYVGSGGNTTSSDMLGVNITMPTQMYGITTPYQVIAWNVMYNSSDTYTQVVEFAPYGTANFRPIASGFTGNATSPFSTVWDLSRMGVGKGTYTIRITVTDGLFMAMATRDVQINYVSGEITIGQPDSRLPGY